MIDAVNVWNFSWLCQLVEICWRDFRLNLIKTLFTYMNSVWNFKTAKQRTQKIVIICLKSDRVPASTEYRAFPTMTLWIFILFPRLFIYKKSSINHDAVELKYLFSLRVIQFSGSQGKNRMRNNWKNNNLMKQRANGKTSAGGSASGDYKSAMRFSCSINFRLSASASFFLFRQALVFFILRHIFPQVIL